MNGGGQLGEGKRQWAYPAAAALLSVAVFLLSLAIRGVAPFGERSRAISDLGAQFIPFHALLRDLPSSATTDLFFTWDLGLGVPFLPDFMTYLSSPIAWLVLLFPREQIELALLVVTTLKISLAAALMTRLLLVFRPGLPLLAAAFGTAYATSAWAMDDGAWMPMWLDGLWFFPAACLTALWAQRGVRPVLGTLVIALGWWANFYTAWMVSLGAALFLVAVVGSEAKSVRQAGLAVARFAVRGLLGVLLIAVVLLPTYLAAAGAQEAPTGDFSRKPWSLFAARLLPLTEGALAAPGLFVSTTALVALAALVAQRSETVRTRVVWIVMLLVVLLSMQVPLTQAAWHGFDRPNGGAFRETFVVTGLIVIAAWLGVSHLSNVPSRGARLVQAGFGLVGLLGVVGVAVATGTGRAELHPATLPTVIAVGVMSTVLMFGLVPLWPRTAGLALLALVFCEMVATAVAIDAQRTGFHRYPVWSAADSREARSVGEAAMERHWPRHRVTLGEDVRANGPALYGIAGMSYYSSSMAQPTAEVLTTLGLGWTSFGRGMAGTTDPGATPLLAIGEAVGDPAAQPLPLALPMIRPVPASAEVFDNPFETRDSLYGADVYTEPIHAAIGDAAEISCPGDSILQGWAPGSGGTWSVGGTPVAVQATVMSLGSQETRPGVQSLGDTSGEAVDVTFVADGPAGDETVVLSCLQRQALDDVVADMAEPSTLNLAGSHVVASWTSPPGEVVVATAYSDGWQCGEAKTRSLGGFLAADLAGASTLDCRYRPAGLVPGAAASLVALLALVLLWLWRRRPKSE